MKRADASLYAYWSKKNNDVIYCYPRKIDGALLHWQFSSHRSGSSETGWSKTLFEELEARGYDLSTFKFSIRLKDSNG